MRFAVLALLVLTLSANVQNQNDTARIKGRVLDLFGNPIAEAQIRVSGRGLTDRSLATDQNGLYEVVGIQPGNYSVSATLRGFHQATRNVYVGPGDQVVVELGLQPGRLAPSKDEAIIRGRVKQTDGGLASGSTVTINSAFNDEIREQLFVSSTGDFEIRLAEPGQYLIYVANPGFTVAASSFTIPAKFLKEPLVIEIKLRPLQ